MLTVHFGLLLVHRGVAGTVVKVTLMKKEGTEISVSVTRGSSV